jgi:hypothetical protein
LVLRLNQEDLVANLIIDDLAIVVSLSALEKVEALRGDVTVPRSAVTRIRIVPDGMAEVHGVRAPGTGLPGVIMVGVWRSETGATFAACHGHGPAVVIDLDGAQYDRLVVTVGDPEGVRRSLEGAP